jgi:hypothetical protein
VLAKTSVPGLSFVKKLAHNEPFRFVPKRSQSLVMKSKRNLTKLKARRPRRKFETTQKKDRDAIDAAFKRMIADDGFRPYGAFGRKAGSASAL